MLPIFHALAVIFAGWLNRHQQRVLDYFRKENRILKAQFARRKLQAIRSRRMPRRASVGQVSRAEISQPDC